MTKNTTYSTSSAIKKFSGKKKHYISEIFNFSIRLQGSKLDRPRTAVACEDRASVIYATSCWIMDRHDSSRSSRKPKHHGVGAIPAASLYAPQLKKNRKGMERKGKKKEEKGREMVGTGST